MRYHWGQGVGHLHAHQSTSHCIPDQSSEQPMAINALDDPDPEELPDGEDSDTCAADKVDDYELDNPEFALEDRDLDGWEDLESDAADDAVHNPESEDDDGDIYD